MSTLPNPLDKSPLPIIGAPLFIISNPKLVIAQCIAGVVGAMPALNARPTSQLEDWLAEITETLAAQAMGADFAYIGSAFIATHEARAGDAYKQAIVAGSSDDIVYCNLFTGIRGNYLAASIRAAGLDPDQLPQSDPSTMNFGGDAKKAWKDIWGCGQVLVRSKKSRAQRTLWTSCAGNMRRPGSGCWNRHTPDRQQACGQVRAADWFEPLTPDCPERDRNLCLPRVPGGPNFAGTKSLSGNA